MEFRFDVCGRRQGNARILYMTTLPLAEVRANLSKLVDEAVRTHQRIEVTRQGRRAAVILSAEDYDYLVGWCDRLEPQVADLNQRAEQSLIHGDAHVGNLLRDASAGILLCDFDATCIGPWQVDLAAVAVGEARFGKTGAHRALAGAYGYDVTSDRDWPLLREARELKMIAAATPLLASSSSVTAEFATRLKSVAQRNHGLPWKPFADLV